AEGERQRHGIQTAALIGVDEVEPYGRVAHTDLTWPGIADFHFLPPKLVRPAGLVNADCMCHRIVLPPPVPAWATRRRSRQSYHRPARPAFAPFPRACTPALTEGVGARTVRHDASCCTPAETLNRAARSANRAAQQTVATQPESGYTLPAGRRPMEREPIHERSRDRTGRWRDGDPDEPAGAAERAGHRIARGAEAGMGGVRRQHRVRSGDPDRHRTRLLRRRRHEGI